VNLLLNPLDLASLATKERPHVWKILTNEGDGMQAAAAGLLLEALKSGIRGVSKDQLRGANGIKLPTRLRE
jgi:hypothetical protein